MLQAPAAPGRAHVPQTHPAFVCNHHPTPPLIPCPTFLLCFQTTLLDVLAGRKTVGTISGEILYSGNVPSPQFLRRFTGYVEQFGGCSSSVDGATFAVLVGVQHLHYVEQFGGCGSIIAAITGRVWWCSAGMGGAVWFVKHRLGWFLLLCPTAVVQRLCRSGYANSVVGR